MQGELRTHIEPPLPYDMPSTRPNSSAITPLIVPPRKTAKGWQRYAVMICSHRQRAFLADAIDHRTLSSGLIAVCMPTDTASCKGATRLSA